MGVNCNLWAEGREIARYLKTGDFEDARERLSRLMNRMPRDSEWSLEYKRDFFKSFVTGIFFALPANGTDKSEQYEEFMNTCFQCFDRAGTWRELKTFILQQLQAVVLLFNDHGTHRKKLITEAQLFIEKHFRENITQIDLLIHLNVSRTWFKSTFKQETGYTFTESLRKRRVEEACSLLKSTTYPLWRIAYDAGLSTDRTMRRAFREELGVSPQTYRRNHEIV